jgi:hypothetical protein
LVHQSFLLLVQQIHDFAREFEQFGWVLFDRGNASLQSTRHSSSFNEAPRLLFGGLRVVPLEVGLFLSNSFLNFRVQVGQSLGVGHDSGAAKQPRYGRPLSKR